MPTDYGDYTIDDIPTCPNCRGTHIGVHSSGYNCLNCKFEFASFKKSVKVKRPTLPEIIVRIQKFLDKIITVDDVEVVKDWHEKPSNLIVLKEFVQKKREKPEPPKEEGYLPNDYEECSTCGFDHKYDRLSAERWHQENES